MVNYQDYDIISPILLAYRLGTSEPSCYLIQGITSLHVKHEYYLEIYSNTDLMASHKLKLTKVDG